MALPNCPLPQPTESIIDDTAKFVEWDNTTKTRLATIAKNRHEALSTLASMNEAVDPVMQKTARVAQQAQQYWETMVFEAGHLALLSPQRSSSAGAWLVQWLGVKAGIASKVREPLLNIKRQADGMMRETAVYTMMAKQRELVRVLKHEAGLVGDIVHPEDMRRALEEGMIPQRLAIYGNTDEQQRLLMKSYDDYVASMEVRGYSPTSISAILEKAADVSAQLDAFQAVQKATGMNVETMYNVGIMPRQFTEDGFSIAKLAGGVKISDEGEAIATINKSRSTWKYIPEDHTMISQLLEVGEDELHGLIANPGDFAQFLSKKVSGEQIDAMVDAGLMSKIPMLTSDVNEYLTRKYGLPLGTTDLFIADPMEATKVLADKLKIGVERSAMVKLVETEGLKAGWAVPPHLPAIEPQFSNFIPLKSIPEFSKIAGDSLVHPIVASQLKALVSISKSPAEISKAARMYQTFTSLFSKQALGNPITGHAYLTGQFLGNMITSFGGGASLVQYGTSVQDVLKLAFKGLDEFDTTPKYLIDGVELSERDLVAKTMRMFSHDILPGITGRERLLKFEYFNPVRITEQAAKLHAASHSAPEYAKELAKMMGRTHDAALSPTLRMAAILDTASHLALIRQHAARLDGGGGSFLLSGVDAGRMTTWKDLTDHVLKHVPVFDDMGKVQIAISRIFPFTGWAMQNLPLQLADMVRSPSKWYNYARVHALWNDSVLDGEEIPNGEMSPADAAKYGIVLRRDSTNKGTVILQTDQYDGKWSALGWLINLVPKDGVKKESVTTNPIQTAFNQALSKSYFSGMYKAVSGIDPYTGRKTDPSEYNGANQFMGITMAPWLQNILSISPILTSVDRLPLISGTRAVIDPRTGVELEPAVRNWLGGAGELPPSRLNAVEQTAQILGGRVRYIDGVQNMRYTESETERAVETLVSTIQKEQVNLAHDLKTGAISKDSDSYNKRLTAIHKMADAAIQLNFDLARIQIWGIKNQIPSGKQMLEFKQRGLVLDNLPLPGGDYIRQSLDDAYKLKFPGGQ
jgi:hypothetical protein